MSGHRPDIEEVLKKPQDLFTLSSGDVVTKKNLYDLIRLSKVANSDYWSGPEWLIGNTPQQGINWVGEFPYLHAVIIKTRPGSYEEDGWSDELKSAYHYSFKARNGKISYSEKANQVLIRQPQHLYPIFLFTEQGNSWHFEGSFSVVEIEEKFVVLHRGTGSAAELLNSTQEEAVFYEGGRHYVTHLMAERNPDVVRTIKQTRSCICDICGVDFMKKYGVHYIEAHHKVPISTYSERHIVRPSDFALLCPNCHKAVHAYMKSENKKYEEIKSLLRHETQNRISCSSQSTGC